MASTMDLFHFSIASVNVVCCDWAFAGGAEPLSENDTRFCCVALPGLLLTTLTMLFRVCFGLSFAFAHLMCTLTRRGLLDLDLPNTLLVLCTFLFFVGILTV